MFNAFLKIDGIDGECKDSKHSGWITALSYTIGLSQSSSPIKGDAGGAAEGRSEFDDLVIRKYIDNSSPQISFFCAKGNHIAEVILELWRAGGEKMKYMEYKLTNAIISSVKTEVVKVEDSRGRQSEFPIETVGFDYGRIDWTYTPQSREGGTGEGDNSEGYDIEQDE